MTMLVGTSLDAWCEVKQTIAKRHTLVFNIIEKYPDHTAGEYSKILHKPLNTISGRFSELSELGSITKREPRICAATGGTSHTWRVVA